ncbi:MAG TPA: PIG-L deacetylase family protein [Acidimicrobiales bacterium]|nr:PIG-L deacetylase family protein [Acidimicrobiales bacterium]
MKTLLIHDPAPDRTYEKLPGAADVLAVVAHPDDESFGLGAVLAAFADHGARVRVVCFTHGEASTLGQTGPPLAEARAAELRSAADVLGIDEVELLAYADGCLGEVPLEELTALVADALAPADLLLVFDQGGITGHPDHRRATEAACAVGAAHRIPVLAWALPDQVAGQLNAELGTGFVGRAPDQIDITIDIDRDRQHDAIACHASQSTHNPVLGRRLELSGAREHLRWLIHPRDPADRPPPEGQRTRR